jgi:excisionase family DNA binding protein
VCQKDHPAAAFVANGCPQAARHRPESSVVWHDRQVAPRFLTLADVSEVLNISAAQAYALVRSGDLPAIKVGGRGQWRVEATALEEYIARQYEQTREVVRTHPFGADDPV